MEIEISQKNLKILNNPIHANHIVHAQLSTLIFINILIGCVEHCRLNPGEVYMKVDTCYCVTLLKKHRNKTRKLRVLLTNDIFIYVTCNRKEALGYLDLNTLQSVLYNVVCCQ